MTQNDFFVAIQFILEQALNEGWELDRVVRDANDAVLEFEEEMERDARTD